MFSTILSPEDTFFVGYRLHGVILQHDFRAGLTRERRHSLKGTLEIAARILREITQTVTVGRENFLLI